MPWNMCLSLNGGRIIRAKHYKVLDKLYMLPEPVMRKIRVPSIDAPVVAVSSATILLSEGESGPKDTSDKKIKSALKKCFEASSQTFRVSVASSIRASVASMHRQRSWLLQTIPCHAGPEVHWKR